MTGYQSKRAAAQDKLEQWDTPSEAFNDWWDSDYDDSTNPYEKDTFAYWAWAGWQAALAQQTQEPASVTYKEVQDSMNALEKGTIYQQVIAEELGQRKLYTRKLYTALPQRTWVGLTDDELAELSASGLALWDLWRAIEAKLKEKNNG
jgi:hypothetical protein